MKGAIIVKEIQIKNFRSLKDTGLQKLSPITVLVGENSSGKSTFLRSFPLLKQSISKRTSGPILWAGDVDDYVDFGSFEETVTNDGSDNITFKFCFEANNMGIWYRIFPGDHANSRDASQKDKISYEIVIKSQNNRDNVTQFNLNFNDIKTHFDLVRNTVDINDDFHYVFKNKQIDMDVREMRNVHSIFSPRSMCFGFTLPDMTELWDSLVQPIQSLNEKENRYNAEPFEVVLDIGRQIIYNKNSNKLLLKQISDRNIPKRYKEFYEYCVKSVFNSSNKKLQYVFVLFYLYTICPDIDEYISDYFKNVHYIAPLRATAERYYRLRNLAVDEVDYQGKNLAIFINSLSGNRKKSFHEWTDAHFGFSIETLESAGHISLRVKLKGSDKAINLSDTGFGYSQVLPIITQLWDLASRKPRTHRGYKIDETGFPLVIAIEQPELHLHPALQAKLAKAFIACIDLARNNGRELQLILETHSDTIINYLGRAVAHNQLDKDDVSIILFDRNFEQGRTEVKNSSFDSDGYLINWPYGFFDAEE